VARRQQSARQFLLLLCVLALAGTAVAISTATASGGGGLEYRVDDQILANDGLRNKIDEFCPNHTSVTGGGVQLRGLHEDLELVSSTPQDLNGDGKPDDGWLGDATNASPKAEFMAVFAICDKHGKYRYPSHETSLPSNGGGAARQVNCPSGTSVTGGGVDTSGNNHKIELARSFPVDGPDGNHRADDAWFGAATNGSGSEQSITVFAICAVSGNYKYLQQSEFLADEEIDNQRVDCPPGTQVTGGGVDAGDFNSGDPTGVEVRMSFPFDGPDKDTLPDNGWVGGANNDNAGVLKNFKTFAICKQ
jgi:hypothetical protein